MLPRTLDERMYLGVGWPLQGTRLPSSFSEIKPSGSTRVMKSDLRLETSSLFCWHLCAGARRAQLRAGPVFLDRIALLWQLEIHSDLRLDFDRFAVQKVRFIFPLAHGVDSRASENCISAELLHAADAAIFGDAGYELHRSFEMHLFGLARIDRLDALDEHSLRDTLRNFQCLCLSNGVGNTNRRVHDARNHIAVRR